MRAVIAGAGSVGRSVAADLVASGHDVTIIDRSPAAQRTESVPEARWLLADACELATLAGAHVEQADVVVAATGDDKANLVVSLLARTEFGVPRTVARVNHPKNEWLFDASWGVDVAVSTPRILTALVEEAFVIGDVVRIFSFAQSGADILELTLPASSPYVGARVAQVPWPVDAVLVCIVRDHAPRAPGRDDTLEAGDELLFVTGELADPAALHDLLAPGPATT